MFTNDIYLTDINGISGNDTHFTFGVQYHIKGVGLILFNHILDRLIAISIKRLRSPQSSIRTPFG